MFLLDVSCGNYFNVDAKIPELTSLVVSLIQIAIPVLLIIFGMLDLGKAVVAQKEDEIKKGQQTFIKRLLAAAIVFFVIMIVKVIFNIVAPEEQTGQKDMWACVECLIDGVDKCWSEQ